MKFYRNEQIELLAEQRLREFTRILGRPLSLPVDIELYGEHVLGLSILWEEIEEQPGEEVHAGLRAADRLVIMNERHKVAFEENAGWRRLTQGHEMGHWDLFVDVSKLEHPAFFESMSQTVFAYRSAAGGQVQAIKGLLKSEEGRDLIRSINARADLPDEARAVNRYSSAVLMPRALIMEEARKVDRTKWPSLYRLRDMFGVSISALRVRLEQLNLLYLDETNKKLYACREDACGQARLF